MKKRKNQVKKKKKRKVGNLPRRKEKRRFLWLNVLPDDLWLKVKRGQSIWEALQDTDVELEGECGGLGRCGKCKIRVISSIAPASEEEKEILDKDELKAGVRLACRITLKKDLTVHIEHANRLGEYHQILKSGERPLFYFDPLIEKRLVAVPNEPPADGLPDLDRIKLAMGPEYKQLKASLSCLRTLPDALTNTGFHGTSVVHDQVLLDWQPADYRQHHYGLVFDLGTSTLVGKLINLNEGSEIVAVSRLNSQIRSGANVISRLQYVEDHSHGLKYLNELLIKDLQSITRRLLEVEGLKPRDIFIIVAAGNTTMQHLLLRLNPAGIAGAPFAPVLNDGLILKASDVGLRLHPEALFYLMPTRSGYIGGDLISVIIASGAAEQEEKMILGLDLGTNGEIFLGNRKRLMTCSAAAGPALEGSKISHGMIAKSGAIEGVRTIEERLQLQIIGNIKPKGICGSGLVDLAAVLLHCGIVDYEGLILPPGDGTPEQLRTRLVEEDGVYHFVVASTEESFDRRPILLTQKDVRELQLAKGAVAAGIQILLDTMGIDLEGIDQIYLAGALGNYINPYSAMRVGLIPRVNPEIIKSLGNAASTGASMVLLSKAYWKMANDLARSIEHIELSNRSDFSEYFVENMDFPRESLW